MKLSVVLPVYHEQDRINCVIDDIRRKADCEIIVIDPIGDTIKSIVDQNVIFATSSKGRSLQMNKGVEISTGDTLLFLHADTTIAHDFYGEIETILKDYDAGAFKFTLDDSGIIFKLIEKGVWLRNKITKTPYGDQAVFCKKEVFQAIGGFKKIPIMEDVRMMQDLKKNGYKIYLSEKPVITSARRWKSEGILYTMLRNWTIISLYYLGISPAFLKKFYK